MLDLIRAGNIEESSRTSYSMGLNDKEVIFKDYNSETIYLSPNTNELNIDYNLEDDKPSVNLSYDKQYPRATGSFLFIAFFPLMF